MEPIITPRLRIRSLELPDLPEFFAYRSDPEVTKYQGFDVMTEEQAEGFIKVNATKTFGKPGEWVQYGIEDRKTTKLIGDCALKLDLNDPDTAEIGITLSPLHQKKGYAKEVMLALLAFLFDKKGIRRVTETVDAENTASINLLKSTGFRLEGHFIENVFFKGKWGSEFQYAMLNREWDARKH
ncbi:GNAT family N-acetyltransferase [Chryseobacterium sp.]|uniref:GNAT family N-acetyltransferase n=1 Tax=Chryseobacterium sp. TaxID=1871047 RepID=UPI0011C93F25|nr:GNAT family protein [Chryseobacterium sp.]TXF74938.1 GNAT family N-acetyltransferase [Chryseobacterium sp.]